MFFQTLLILIHAFSFLKSSSALITINPETCGLGQRYTTVNDSLYEAFDMAENAANTATATDSRTQGLLSVLLGRDTSSIGAMTSKSSKTLANHIRTELILCPILPDIFATVANYPQTQPTITIFCGDSFIVQQPDGQWWDLSSPFSPSIVTSAEALSNFQVFNCSSSGYLAYALLPDKIMLCDAAFGRLAGGNTIGNLRQATLLNEYLDSYNVLSGTLLHEMLHIQGNGLSKFSNSRAIWRR